MDRPDEISVDFALPAFGAVVRAIVRSGNFCSIGPARIYNGEWQSIRGPYKINPTHWSPIGGERVPSHWYTTGVKHA